MAGPWHISLSGFALLLSMACASEPTSDGSAGNNAGQTNAGGGDGPGEPEACPEGSHPGTAPQLVFVGQVLGQIVDEHGEATSSGLVQVCSKDLCLQVDVDDSGTLTKTVNVEMDTPACKFGDGRQWGKLAVQLAEGDSELGTLTTVRLPDFADGAALTPGEVAHSGGVTLSLDADARVELDTLIYEDESEHVLRAAQPPEPALQQLGQDFVVAYALSPVETVICPSPALSLENTADLAPGTELELFIHGLDVGETWAPYAAWEKVGEGQVSDDGASLEFPQGLPLLTAIGVREKR